MIKDQIYFLFITNVLIVRILNAGLKRLHDIHYSPITDSILCFKNTNFSTSPCIAKAIATMSIKNTFAVLCVFLPFFRDSSHQIKSTHPVVTTTTTRHNDESSSLSFNEQSEIQ